MYLLCVILAVIVILITIYWEYKYFKEKGIRIPGMILGFYISLLILTLPLFKEYNVGTQIIYSVLYAAQSIYLNEDFSLVSGIASEYKIIIWTYKIVIYALFVVLPILSVTAILSFFKDFISSCILKISRKKEYHFFSEANVKTIAIGENILSSNQNARVIFMNKKESKETVNNKHFFMLKEKINEIDFFSIKKKKYIYFMSENEEENLNDSLELLSNLSADDEFMIYILSSKQEAYLILDSVIHQRYAKAGLEEKEKAINEKLKENSKLDKFTTYIPDEPKLKVEVINETERTVFQRLENLPIPKIFNIEKKQVTVLIVGLR